MKTAFIVFAFLLELLASASADTYKLGAGTVGGEHRCASPKALTRLTDFVAKEPKITIGHGQMTATTDKPRGADRVVVDSHGVVHTGFWHGALIDNGKAVDNGAILLEIVIDTYGWATSQSGNKHQPEATIRIAQTFDGATCIEEWHGNAELVH